MLQLIVSSLYLSAAAAGIVAASFARRTGRKVGALPAPHWGVPSPLHSSQALTLWQPSQLPLFVAGIAFVAGAGVMAGAVDVGMLVAGRVLLGIGVGLASLVVPMCTLPYCILQRACMGSLNPNFFIFFSNRFFRFSLPMSAWPSSSKPSRAPCRRPQRACVGSMSSALSGMAQSQPAKAIGGVQDT